MGESIGVAIIEVILCIVMEYKYETEDECAWEA